MGGEREREREIKETNQSLSATTHLTRSSTLLYLKKKNTQAKVVSCFGNNPLLVEYYLFPADVFYKRSKKKLNIFRRKTYAHRGLFGGLVFLSKLSFIFFPPPSFLFSRFFNLLRVSASLVPTLTARNNGISLLLFFLCC